jgi:hypothetical protein
MIIGFNIINFMQLIQNGDNFIFESQLKQVNLTKLDFISSLKTYANLKEIGKFIFEYHS